MDLFLVKSGHPDGSRTNRIYTKGFIAAAAAVKLWQEVNCDIGNPQRIVTGPNVWQYGDADTSYIVIVSLYEPGTDIE